MLQPNSQTDPLVEILRLAYRRGLAVRQEQAEKSEALNAQPLDEGTLTAELKDSDSGNESKQERGKG
jgi:hypothetical protein